jgi:hypothetical protein
LLALAVVVAACGSSAKVAIEYDKAANFKGYRTYAWLPREPGPEQAQAARDPRLREAAMRAIDEGLAAKGLTRTDIDKSPDLLVAVHGWAVNRIDVQAYGYAYGPVPYGYYPVGPTGVDVRTYRDGTMIIDLVDARTKKMVWRGTATDTFEPGAEVKTVRNAAKQTLEDYPPPL